MNWVTDLLKHLELSKVGTAALFLTSLAFLVAPHYLPNVIEGPPSEWRWVIWALCIFSGILLAIWGIGALWGLLRSLPRKVRRATATLTFTPHENGFLAFMGKEHPNSTLDLDHINNPEGSKLETLGICASLERKGLLWISPVDTDYVRLTDAGRERALELLRQQRPGNA